MKAIINANLILEDGIIYDGVLLMDGGLITAFAHADEIKIPPNTQILNAKGRYLGPGFVDLHCHGGNGAMFHSDPETAAAYFLSHGQTTTLATLYYDLSYDQMLESIVRIQRTMTDTTAGRAIGGIYMEGPYMNPLYGASPEKNKWRGTIDMARATNIVRQCGKFVRVWAIAPERPGIEDFIRMAKSVNPQVSFAFGHTHATPAQIFALKKYDLHIQTHSTNATNVLDSSPGTRTCGPDEACLYDSDIYAEVICDSHGIHIHPDMMRFILRIKGEDKVIIITDSFVSNATPPENLRHITDLMFDANGSLSGSNLTMDVACLNMMRHTRTGLCQVFRMASLNPARAVGLDSQIGSIALGKKANLVLVDDRVSVHAVILGGDVVVDDF